MERPLLEFVIRTTLIALATGAALWALRIRTAAVRHAAWAGVIFAMLLLPAWRWWGPTASLRVPPAQIHAAADALPEVLEPAFIAVVAASAPVPQSPRHIDGSGALLGIYSLVASLLLLRLAMGTMRARRLTSASCSAPVTVGLFRPRIILPESAREWTPSQLDAVLTHEREHVRRRDPLFQWLALFNRALFWFHPLSWWLEHRLAALAEEACDAAVTESGHDPREYSMCLLEMARAVERAGARVNVVAMSMPGVYLPQRIKRIVAGVRAPRVSRTRLACAALVCAIPAGLFASAVIQPVLQRPPLPPKLAQQVPTMPAPLLLAQAQTAVASPPAAAPAVSPAAPEFEVASVRPSNPDQGFINSTTPSLNIGGDHYLRFVQITLRDLIMLAYGVGSGQVQGPGFLFGSPDNPADRFDVNAKVPSGATPDQVPLMLRALLADRFHLTYHRDTKKMDVYALEVAKGGLKMKESPEGATGEAHCTRSLVQLEGGQLAASCTRMSARDIAQQVQALAPAYFRDGPVVDLTGLNGLYDFTLQWITAGAANRGEPGPSMFDAVQQQLGLKLEKRKQSVDMLVIDKLDRTPTAN